jgi:hypothetical protein
VHGLCHTYHRLRNYFGRTGCHSLVTRLNWKLVSVRLDTVLILIQDRCTVCTERTVSSEIILDALMDLLGDVGHVESRFGPFVDSVSLGAR